MNVLIIGLGSIAKKHIKVLRNILNDINIYALRSSKESSQYEDIINIGALADLNNIKIDFAIISNPTSLHIEKINDFKFNLRLTEKNGNTVIHRLVDQLNERGIEVLLTQDPAIITYKNNNNQTPLEYLLDNYNITRKLYNKEEIKKRVNEYVLDIDKDISIENKSK